MCRHFPDSAGEDEFSHYCCREFHSLGQMGCFTEILCVSTCFIVCSRHFSPFSAKDTFNGILVELYQKTNIFHYSLNSSPIQSNYKSLFIFTHNLADLLMEKKNKQMVFLRNRKWKREICESYTNWSGFSTSRRSYFMFMLVYVKSSFFFSNVAITFISILYSCRRRCKFSEQRRSLHR